MYASTWICTKTDDLLNAKKDRKMSTLLLPDSAISAKVGSMEGLQV